MGIDLFLGPSAMLEAFVSRTLHVALVPCFMETQWG